MSNGFAPWDSIIEQAHISELLFTKFGVKMVTGVFATDALRLLFLKGTLLQRFKGSANMSNLVPFQLNVIVCVQVKLCKRALF